MSNYQQWVNDNLSDLRAKYAGEWIAVYYDKVVAHNKEFDLLKAIIITDGVSAQPIEPHYVFIPLED